MLSEHAKVSEEGLVTMKGVEAKLSLKEGSKPKFCKPRSVPFALREVIERDLDRLEDMRVLEMVNHSRWASPIVSVVKSDNSIRICGDYKVTENNMLNIDQFPFPTLKNYLQPYWGGGGGEEGGRNTPSWICPRLISKYC